MIAGLCGGFMERKEGMERHAGHDKHWSMRAARVTMLTMSIFLILILDSLGPAQPGPLAKLAAPSAEASVDAFATPAEGRDKSQNTMRITPPREPNAPLFAEAEEMPAPASSEVQEMPTPVLSEADQIRELNRMRDDLATKARECQLRLIKVPSADTAKRQQVAGEMRSIYQQMCDVEQGLADIHQQRRQAQSEQVNRELERARACSEQIEKLRTEMEDAQRQINAVTGQDREQSKDLASAIQQVQREIRIQEQRLSRLGISYTPRAEPNLPGLRLPESVAREPAPTPVSVPVYVPQPEPQEVIPPAPERVPPPQPVAAEPNDPIREMRDQIRQLRAELTAAQQKRQVPEVRVSAKTGSAVDRGAERRRQRLEAVADQLRDSASPGSRDNPYSVGSADRGWQPNTGW
jgi:hypothetical protein